MDKLSYYMLRVCSLQRETETHWSANFSRMKVTFFFSGNLILGGGRIRAHPSDPRKTIVDYILCADLKGLDASGEKADQTLIKFMIEDIESAKDQIEKIRVRARKQSQGDEEEHLF